MKTENRTAENNSEETKVIIHGDLAQNLQDLRTLGWLCHKQEHGYNVFKCATVCADLPNCPSKVTPTGFFQARVKQITVLQSTITQLREENERLKAELKDLDTAANHDLHETKETNLNLHDALTECWKRLCKLDISKHFSGERIESIQALIKRSEPERPNIADCSITGFGKPNSNSGRLLQKLVSKEKK
jgi:FtsZ-binding cell division protein ZapB